MGFVLKSSSHQRSHYGLSHSLDIDAKSTEGASTSTTGKSKTLSRKKLVLPRRARSESWSLSTARRSHDLAGVAERPVESSLQRSAAANVSDDNVVDTRTQLEPSDGALPSQSSLHDLERVMHLIQDERHLLAHRLYTDVKKRLDYWREHTSADATAAGNIAEEEATDVGGGLTHSQRSHDGQKSMRRSWKNIAWRTSHRDHGHDKNQNDDIINDPSDNELAYKFMMRRIDEFQALEKRATMFLTAQQNLETHTSWTLSQTLFGITTHYRRESDNTLSVKIEGELHGIPLFEQMVVLRECDLYHTWAPFCNESKKLAQLDKLDVVAWYSVGTPLLGMVRDACYRAVGCDCMREDGSVLLVAVGLGDDDPDDDHNSEQDSGGANETTNGQNQQLARQQQNTGGPSTEPPQQQNYQHQRSVTFQESESSSPILNTNATTFLARDEILSTIALPPVPKGIGHGRMTIRNFSASIKILSASSARTKMVVNIDPNLHFLPQSLIDFCMKRMCGVMLARLQAAATKVVKDPIRNPHSRRMREDVRFYRDWLLPKFRTYCDELGWDMPPVKAFEVSEEDLKAEEIFEGWRSADTLDVDSDAENLSRTRIDDAHAAIQRYQLVDKATTLEGNDCTHRRCHSDTSLDSKFRAPKWDLLKRFIPESFLRLQSSGLDNDDCTPSHSGRSVTSTPPQRVRIRDRQRHFFQEFEHRRPQTKEEKAALARERAALRLQPEPFSESKAFRLKELKDAKARAAGRLKKNKGGGKLSGSKFESESSDLHTTPIEPESTSSMRRDVMIFIVSLLLNVALVPLQSYALTTSTLPPYFKMSFSDWVDIITRILLSLLMIALHAISLWSTVNTFLVIAFDTIDFGQKHLAKNLAHGKRLYTAAVKQYSTIVSVAIATISLCFGFLSALFQNTLYKMCNWFDMKFSLPVLKHSWDTLVHFFPTKYVWILDGVSRWMNSVRDSVMMAISLLNTVANQIYLPAVFKYTCILVSWITTKVSSIIPSLLKRLGRSTLYLLFKSLPDALFSHLNVCRNKTASTLSWRYEAFRISSFMATRIGVFILALLFMSYLLLPKPEKRLRQTEIVEDANALVNIQFKSEARRVESCDGDSLSDVSARTSLSQGRQHILTMSSGSIPMEVIEE